jgi:hypothetical protein
VKERTGALVVLSSPVFNAARRQVATLTGRSRLPSIMRTAASSVTARTCAACSGRRETLGVTIPASLLARADGVIQR